MFGESMMQTLGNFYLFFSKGEAFTILGFSGHVVQVAITSQLCLCGARESVNQIRSAGEGEMV